MIQLRQYVDMEATFYNEAKYEKHLERKAKERAYYLVSDAAKELSGAMDEWGSSSADELKSQIQEAINGLTAAMEEL